VWDVVRTKVLVLNSRSREEGGLDVIVGRMQVQRSFQLPCQGGMSSLF
jgi:hypothetical protein